MFDFKASQRDGRPTEIGVSQVTPIVKARPEKRSATACIEDALRNCGRGENIENYLREEGVFDPDARRTVDAIASDFPKTPRPRPTYSGPPMDETIASTIAAFHKPSTNRRYR